MDFLAAYSAVNQGHCHPKIVAAMVKQCQVLTLTSRAFYNDALGAAEERLCSTFGYDKALLMNSGVEAAETAVKLARKWGYEVKRISEDSARVVFAANNFWGRSLAACGSSDDPERYTNFGPFTGMNFDIVPYNDIPALERALQDPSVAAFMVEPIQGEAGVIVPAHDYLSELRVLCTERNVLWIADEIQTGIGRCGKLLAVDWEGVKPDILTLGKSLSGGLMPISVVLANDQVMGVLTPGTHGSTFGGNPLAAKVCQAALDVVFEENLIENSLQRGKQLVDGLKRISGSGVREVRGKGLMVAVEMDSGTGAWELCLKLADNGVLAKPTHESIVRFTPPLIISESEMDEALGLIEKSFRSN